MFFLTFPLFLLSCNNIEGSAKPTAEISATSNPETSYEISTLSAKISQETSGSDMSWKTNFHNGFASWFILQHYENYSGYRPFITLMKFDVDFSGTL
jgi:hypothetical protein